MPRRSEHPTPFDPERFEEWIQRHRTDLACSEEAIAKQFGITLPYMQRLRRGAQTPSLHMLGHMARVAGVSVVEWLRPEYRGNH